jgi:excisionase family DNA binding protein
VKDELTTREVAVLLGFGQTAVLQWARRGYLPHRATPGGHRRYRLSDVEAFQAKMASGGFGPHPLSKSREETKTLQKLNKILKKPGIKPVKGASK